MLFYPPDPKRDPRAFVVARSRPMGQKRGRAEGSFVRETSAQAVEFYRDLVQNLKPWHAPAPKLRTEPESTRRSNYGDDDHSRVGRRGAPVTRYRSEQRPERRILEPGHGTRQRYLASRVASHDATLSSVVRGEHVPGVGQDGSYPAKAVSSRNVELGHKGAFRRVAR